MFPSLVSDSWKAVACGLALLLFLAEGATAGPELIDYPEDYRSSFIRYLELDRPDRNIKRFFYVNAAAMAAARAGRDLPYGTVLIMEDHAVKLDDSGQPLRDDRGRFTASDEITNVFVMEKRPGWGADYPADKRNGEWEYAWFEANGQPKTRDAARFEGCFACHRNRTERDFTFTFYKYLLDTRP